jgi:DNA invertase Pin-like site-specific DNA recombinase
MGAIVGYARVSSTDQNYAGQVQRLQDAGAVKIFSEKRSGVDGDRPALRECLTYLREGDTLLVTKLDRLARSTVDLYGIIRDFESKGVAFRVLDDAAVDTTTRTGKLVLGILALIAEFETSIRKERQMEGIARAKAEGRTGGRPAKITKDMIEKIRNLRDSGRSIRAIAAEMRLSKASIQKTLSLLNVKNAGDTLESTPE